MIAPEREQALAAIKQLTDEFWHGPEMTTLPPDATVANNPEYARLLKAYDEQIARLLDILWPKKSSGVVQ